jgi:hypothetical protein
LDGLLAHFLARLETNALDAMMTPYALMPHAQVEIRRRERQHQTRGDVVDLPELDFARQMRRHFDKVVNFTNETDEQVQRRFL